MAQRDYQTNLNSVQRQDVDASGARGVGARAPSIVGNGQNSAILQGLSNTLGQLGQKLFQTGIENEYIKGQQARYSGAAWDAIDSNPLTRPFTRGGYQDADYQIQLAQAQSDLDSFIQGKGKTLNPTEFAQQANARAQNVLNSMGDGLTVQGRANALKQTSAMLASAQANHLDAYNKYRLGQVQQGMLTLGNQLSNNLDRATLSGDPAQSATAVEQVNNYLEYIQGNQDLPDNAKKALAKDYLVHLAKSGHSDYVNDVVQGGRLNNLGFDDLDSINAAIQSDQKVKQNAYANSNWQQRAQIENAVATGQFSSDQEAVNAIKVGMSMGADASWGQSQLAAYYRLKAKGMPDDQLLSSFQAGDANQVTIGGGGDFKKGVNTASKQIFADPQMSLHDKVLMATNLGGKLGYIPTVASDAIGVSVNSLFSTAQAGGEINADQAAIATDSIRSVAALAKNNQSAANSLLEGMDSDTANKVGYLMGYMGEHPEATIQDGITAYGQEQLDKKTRTPEQASAAAGKTITGANEYVQKAVDSAFGQGGFLGWRRASSAVKAIIGTASTKNAGVESVYKGALTEEMNNLMKDSANRQVLSDHPDLLVQRAQANLNSRIVPIASSSYGINSDRENSYAVLNRGQTLQSVFGSNASQEYISDVLATKYPNKIDGGAVSITQSPAGNLIVNQYDSDGMISTSKEITRDDINSIKSEAEKNQAGDMDIQYRSHMGGQVKGSSKETVTIDGLNTVNLDPVAVYQWRQELVKQEDVKHTAYADKVRQQDGTTKTVAVSVGVGHNTQGSMREGQEASPEQVAQWFKEDSNKALMQAGQVSQEMGVTDTESKLGLAGMIFQMGRGKVDEFTNMKKAIASKDWRGFQNSVENSAWYKHQTPGRAQIFMNHMRRHFLSN